MLIPEPIARTVHHFGGLAERKPKLAKVMLASAAEELSDVLTIPRR